MLPISRGPVVTLLLAGWGLAACSPRTPAPPTGAAPTRAESTSAPAPGAHADPAASHPEPRAEMSSPAAADSSAGTTADTGYVQYDPKTKTVTFRLVAGPFQFNGLGGATLTIPPGTTNIWNFEQADGTPHSAEVASGSGPVPNSGGDPAIPRAYTNKVIEGLPQGATDVIRFTAPDSGTFRIICGVPGHALSGMWLWLKIDPAAKEPSFRATKS
jgi:sulfocyanin SoxE-like protein